ncbi:luciferase family protein [Streptomyces sp. NPDC048385]|uniref:luciferase family protein n=1 Tax=Streptomyces sp. NPDC048385 TaxID=3155145 RepID=UPI00341D8743
MDDTRLRAALAHFPDLFIAPAACGIGWADRTHYREILHHHGPATADVHLTRPLIERLRPESALIRLHPDGGRVAVTLDGSQTALDLLLSLLSLALSADRLVNITNLAWRAPCTLQAAEDREKAPAQS